MHSHAHQIYNSNNSDRQKWFIHNGIRSEHWESDVFVRWFLAEPIMYASPVDAPPA